MKGIPDGSVDMVLCDLPYGTTDCKWDNQIPIGELWMQYRKLLAANGTVVLFGSEPFSTRLRCAAMDLYKYDFIWVKNIATGFIHAKNMPLKKHENISVFSTGSICHKSLNHGQRMKYNPQGLVPNGAMQKPSISKFGSIAGVRPSHKTTFLQEYSNYPNSVLTYRKEGHAVHPSQKPVELLEYLIKAYTDTGDTVLDNCMGSGSTGVACVNTGRDFIGIELDERYFEIVKKRIEDAQAAASTAQVRISDLLNA